MDLRGKNNETKVCDCQWCGRKTDFPGASQCNRCWDLSRRIEWDMELAEKMLQTFKASKVKP